MINDINKDNNDVYQGINVVNDQAQRTLSQVLLKTEQKKNNHNRLIFSIVNANSIPNKLDDIRITIADFVDILVITESKLDQSFPESQFFINRFSKPFRKDRNRHGGGFLMYIKEDIPQKELSFNLPSDIEIIIIELNINKIKWLVCGCYHPPSESDEYFFYHLGKVLDNFSTKHDDFVLLGDFNVQENETILSEFLNAYNAKNIVKNKTCFKSIENPSCVDSITDKPGGFQHTNVFETGISGHRKLVTTVMKAKFKKALPKYVYYRNYKNFNEQDFKLELKGKLEVDVIDANYETFHNVYLNVLNKHALIKTKVIRGNQEPYITKPYRKAVRKRSELKTK